MIKKYVIGLVLALTTVLTVGACKFQFQNGVSVQGSAREAHGKKVFEQEHPIAMVQELKTAYSLDIKIIRADRPRLVVMSTDSTRLADFRIKTLEAGELSIYDAALAGETSRKHYEEVEMLAVDIYLPSLASLDASGATSVVFEGAFEMPSLSIDGSGATKISGLELKAGALSIDLSGASKLNISTLQAHKFSLELSGASKVDAEGEVKVFDCDLSGASKCTLSSLNCTEANIQSSGASKVLLGEVDVLSYSLSGASKLEVKGSPRVRSAESSGASSVNIVPKD